MKSQRTTERKLTLRNVFFRLVDDIRATFQNTGSSPESELSGSHPVISSTDCHSEWNAQPRNLHFDRVGRVSSAEAGSDLLDGADTPA